MIGKVAICRTSYSVPPAIIAFLESNDYESAVRNAVSLGGDADTQACIAGGIAEAFYRDIPEHIKGFYYLFHLNDDFEVVADNCFDSIEQCKKLTGSRAVGWHEIK